LTWCGLNKHPELKFPETKTIEQTFGEIDSCIMTTGSRMRADRGEGEEWVRGLVDFYFYELDCPLSVCGKSSQEWI
jgi:hypothetical protein